MSSQWKSTPNYWCKHCKTYVRDTALERNNHEATFTHQNAVKRSLRELYRGQERQEWEKERAKAEVERLNRLVPGSSSSAARSGAASAPADAASRAATAAAGQGQRAGGAVEAERKRQMEELAGLGVAIPTEFKGDLAMPGEWTVTSARVVMEDLGDDDAVGERDVGARAKGVRKREVTEEQRAEEEAVRGFFKKPRGWGRGAKSMPAEGDADLDALLSGEFGKGSAGGVKGEAGAVKKGVKREEEEEKEGVVKKEEDGIKKEEGGVKSVEGNSTIKPEPEDEGSGLGLGLTLDAPPTSATGDAGPTPLFKKRKAKNIRQK